MKKLILILTTLGIISDVRAQGIEFQKESYREVLRMAEKQHKLIFVDVYTSWCGPCKQMAKTIFPESEVGKFYNTYFLNLQVDAEKSEDGRTIARKYDVSAYPTFLFLNEKEELIYRFVGGRSLDGFLQEGKKALEAAQMRPELEKYRKQYEKGKREKDFLERYFRLKERAGLDCSDVLIDYFARITEDALLDSVTVSRVAKVTVYDRQLVDRLVNALCRKAVLPGIKKKDLAVPMKAVCIYLSACLKKTAQKEDENDFEEVLEQKARLFEATHYSDNIMTASFGGGDIYIPSELSRLNYYNVWKKGEQFNTVFLNYLTVLQKEYEKNRQEREKLLSELDQKMKEAKEKGQEKEYQGIKKMKEMISIFSGFDNYYISVNMLEHVEHYKVFCTTVKNSSFNDQLAEWYVFLHRLSPSVKTAVEVADKLSEMGKAEQAEEVLVLGLEQGKTAPDVQEEDVVACEAKLENLKKKQLGKE